MLFQKLDLWSRQSLVDADVLSEMLQLLMGTVVTAEKKSSRAHQSKVCSDMLCDILSLIDDVEDVERHLNPLNFATLLLDLLMRQDKVIGQVSVQWSTIAQLQVFVCTQSLCAVH